MPNGFGLNNVGAAGSAALNGVSPTGQGGGLAPGALTAIQRLAAAAGHPVQIPEPSGSAGGNGSTDSLPFVVFAAGAALVALAWTASLRAQALRLRRRRPTST
jgi:hypothetical protein